MDRQKEISETAIRLYQKMPGAVLPPSDPNTGNRMWGEIDGTDEWAFCEEIATLIVETRLEASRAVNRLASDHNLV